MGFPHSEIHGLTPARGSPWLIAACHVLHRLSVPRHPPDALKTLDPFVTLSRRDKPTQQETQQTALSALQLSPDPFTQNNDRTRPSRLRGQLPCKAEPIRSHFTKPFFTMSKNQQPLLPTVTAETATDLLLPMDTHHRSTLPNSTQKRSLVEADGIEPTTSCLQSTRSPN